MGVCVCSWVGVFMYVCVNIGTGPMADDKFVYMLRMTFLLLVSFVYF